MTTKNSGCSGEERYDEAIEHIVHATMLWSLRNDDGWVMQRDDRGCECFPVWPSPEFAAACAADAWVGTEPQWIDLDSWMIDWLPALEQTGCLISVFPVEGTTGIVVTADKLREDMEVEEDAYLIKFDRARHETAARNGTFESSPSPSADAPESNPGD